MMRTFLFLSLLCFSFRSFSQEGSFGKLLSDSSMMHASVSLCIANAENGEIVMGYNSEKSLIPASVMKLFTSASALELLGPQYTFITKIGYTGTLNKRTGRLSGNIVIRGGGDPALGSKYFSDHYQDFISSWVTEIRKLGIRKIDGKVITDDSYYDFQPVPAKWLWEDAGNYYGAGAYGLSVFDNTYEIHFKTSSDSDKLTITEIIPDECSPELSNWLTVSGTSDKGYVFAAPYSTNAWLSGTIPANREDFVLKASIPDPPLLIAKIINEKLKAEGIIISKDPSTFRLEEKNLSENFFPIAEIISPPLVDIIEVLNHESVNLFAEHLIKELGKKYQNNGSTASGIEVIMNFLNKAGVNTDGLFIEDGSGLSPLDAINTRELVNLLFYMKREGKYFPEYYSSLPDAGKEGTLKYYFRDPVFDSNLKAKSGSMTRVRSYAGYFTTLSGKKMIFSIIINNYTGPSKNIISGIEGVIKEFILYEQ
ncbi:MAG: D-alanyl-D-alanine carboxypeptidase/D-alanyl-D-alanine-endopeptidase [Bacteroidales bacterium]|nr:D-alanyl-D-alanine carboxypeptidase/D-alanyl-D-alanine-endopeptidase [Bacteroidales bacterium]